MASVVPDAPETAVQPASVPTLVGVATSAVCPSPQEPSGFLPHTHSEPSDFRAAIAAHAPPETDAQSFATPIRTGDSTVRPPESTPSCPDSFGPQTQSDPSVLTPLELDTVDQSLAVPTLVGTNASEVEPMPRSPETLYPHAHSDPSDLMPYETRPDANTSTQSVPVPTCA